jgi:hypothetical protein
MSEYAKYAAQLADALLLLKDAYIHINKAATLIESHPQAPHLIRAVNTPLIIALGEIAALQVVYEHKATFRDEDILFGQA